MTRIGDRVRVHLDHERLQHLNGPGTVASVWEMRTLVPRVPMTVRIDGPDNVVKVEHHVSIDLDCGERLELREGDGQWTPDD